ncbi:MAG: outer membrane beta-barrel protein [Saprospiraceae bacterium]
MRKFFALPFLLYSVQLIAQSKENERFTLGFFVGMETQSLGIQPLDTREPEKAAVRSGRLGMGASVGILARKQIFKGLHFQPELAVSYARNHINFQNEGRREFHYLDAELPLHFIATNWRRNDFPLRPCVIFGGRMGWNFAKGTSDLLNIARERFALDLGLGAEINIGRLRLQPAFVYSHGLNNLHLIGDGQYDDVVGKMVRDRLSLRLSVWRVGN